MAQGVLTPYALTVKFSEGVIWRVRGGPGFASEVLDHVTTPGPGMLQ